MKRVLTSIPGITEMRCYIAGQLDAEYGSGVLKSLDRLPLSQWVTIKSGPLCGKSVYRSGTYVLTGECRKSPQAAPQESVVAGQSVEASPTEAQKKSGAYKKGHVTIDGMSISIENPVGFYREGTDKNGKKWRQKLHCDYGYFLGTVGYDKDHVDCFVKPSYRGGNGLVYIVNQVDPSGKFDEHKVMLGFTTTDEARSAYLSNYEPGWTGLKNIAEVPLFLFKKWLKSGGPKKGELTMNDEAITRALSDLEKSIADVQQALPHRTMLKSATMDNLASFYSKIFDLVGLAANEHLVKAYGAELQKQNPGSQWRTIADKDSPLHGRHILIGSDGKIIHGGAKDHWYSPDEDKAKKLSRGVKNVDKILEKTESLSASDRAKLKKHKRLLEEHLAEYNQKNMRDMNQHLAIGERIDDTAEKSRDDAIVRAVEAAIRGEGIDADSIGGKSGLQEIGKWCLDVVPAKVSDIKVDPETFQFKTKVGKTGETDKLKDVSVWDPLKAGTIMVWQSKDGEMYVANGHHRMELANRLGVPYMNTSIYKESDGYTKADARRIAAETNIAEGNATLEDSVKYLRETGYSVDKMKSLGIPMTEGRARQAYHIAQLKDTAYKQFVNGKLTPKYAEAIGEFAHDETKQEAVLSMLADKKFGVISGDVFRQMLPGVLSTMDRAKELAGSSVSGDQGSFNFFDDDEEFQNSLKLEKFQAQLADKIGDHIGKIRRVLSVPEKLSSGEVSEIADEYGIRVKSDRDLAQVRDALKELEARIDPARRHTDSGVKSVMSRVMDRKIKSGLPVDKWSVDDEDIGDVKRHFIDDYETNRIDKQKLTM